MEKRKLNTVTLLGIDCVDIERLILAADICQEQFEFAEVKLLTSLESTHKDIIKIDHLGSVDAYSEFMIKHLDEYVTTPYVLIFQYDGFILNPLVWDDEFLTYDYIGAPSIFGEWALKFGITQEYFGQWWIGNGGFSLRSKKLVSLCATLASENKIENCNQEDLVICFWKKHLFEENGITFAPYSVATRFSFEGETKESNKWTNQFGFHGLRWSDISNWLKVHPEYILDKEANTLTCKQ